MVEVEVEVERKVAVVMEVNLYMEEVEEVEEVILGQVVMEEIQTLEVMEVMEQQVQPMQLLVQCQQEAVEVLKQEILEQEQQVK